MMSAGVMFLDLLLVLLLEYEGNTFVYWHPAAGTGLRIKFNKISPNNICVDIGISKNFTGIYLSLGEVF
jgi:hypothetical protein